MDIKKFIIVNYDKLEHSKIENKNITDLCFLMVVFLRNGSLISRVEKWVTQENLTMIYIYINK